MTDERRTETMATRFTALEKQRLLAFAERSHRTPSDIVRAGALLYLSLTEEELGIVDSALSILDRSRAAMSAVRRAMSDVERAGKEADELRETHGPDRI